MIQLDASSPFVQYRVPREHGSAIVEPSFADAPGLLAENRALLSQQLAEDPGLPWKALRQEARQDLITAALHYTRSYRDYSGAISADGPLILAGHQPELFHPGVWFKNFALSRLGERLNATVINLVVDNDLRGTPAVRVPVRQPSGRLGVEAVPMDAPGQAIPYEQHRIVDPARFASFGERLHRAVAPFVAHPAVVELWPHAQAAARRCENTGCALAQGRHALEATLGLQTLEVPLSVVCRSRGFATFVLGLLGQLPRFHECYNSSLHAYRAAHQIRSRAHPVPALGEAAGWLEAPLWIYSDDAPERRPAWVRLQDDGLEISDRESRTLRIEAPADSPAAAEELIAKTDGRFKLRPRALVTTMYARLVLSDLFLHGIGGGKYDQLGDLIVRRFFGFEPPRFMVLSATALLPAAPPAFDETEPRRLDRRLRDTVFRPEAFADQAPLDPALLEAKRQLLAEIPPRGAKRAWHERMEAINRQLAEPLQGVRETLQRRLQEAQERARQAQLLRSREYAFCIYPLDYLERTFADLIDDGTD